MPPWASTLPPLPTATDRRYCQRQIDSNGHHNNFRVQYAKFRFNSVCIHNRSGLLHPLSAVMFHAASAVGPESTSICWTHILRGLPFGHRQQMSAVMHMTKVSVGSHTQGGMGWGLWGMAFLGGLPHPHPQNLLEPPKGRRIVCRWWCSSVVKVLKVQPQ